MKSEMNKEIKDFFEELSSGSPTPGGGGASAMIGMVCSALCSMVGNLTSGKKKYAAYQSDIEEVLVQAKAATERLYQLIDEDALAFAPLAKAYGIPKDQADREEILEAALVVAARVPMEIVEEVYKLIPMMEQLVDKGSRLAISDVAVAAAACESALKGAVMNVYINTKLMKNREVAIDMNE
ncbi:MAG: cyclodeaminase/cyclohydrolase family protein, partial [Eubacteriales bacterium]